MYKKIGCARAKPFYMGMLFSGVVTLKKIGCARAKPFYMGMLFSGVVTLIHALTKEAFEGF